VTGWFRIDPDPTFAAVHGGPGAAGLFLNGDAGSGHQNQFGFGVQSTVGEQFGLLYHAAGQADQVTSFRSLAQDVWYFAAQVSDAEHDTLSVYLWDSRPGNNLALASETYGLAVPVWFERIYEMDIGANPCCPAQLFDGAIADVRLFDESLSESQLWQLIQPSLTVPGDLNGDVVADSLDIDLLSVAIRDGIQQTPYDLNIDGRVDSEDRVYWVKQIKQTWFGDSSLDGQFDSGDLVDVFQAGTYEDNVPGSAGWQQGDWDGDGDFTSGDLVLAFSDGGYEQGRLAIIVPEPAVAGWSLALLLLRRPLRAKPIPPFGRSSPGSGSTCSA
jgi:hypothetical protein